MEQFYSVVACKELLTAIEILFQYWMEIGMSFLTLLQKLLISSLHLQAMTVRSLINCITLF